MVLNYYGVTLSPRRICRALAAAKHKIPQSAKIPQTPKAQKKPQMPKSPKCKKTAFAPSQLPVLLPQALNLLFGWVLFNSRF